jgi:DmsE family decaheme c-type cytochrome
MPSLTALTARLAFAVAILSGSLFVGSRACAADEPGVFKEGTSGDAVCTRCHGAGEKKPILSIHRTRHGVAGQPGCQACHGSSRGHVRHADDTAARPPPDFVFGGANPSFAEVQSRTCLNCHQTGQRSHWRGSAHPGNDVTCASCHQIHQPQDRVLSKETQREVCFACHQIQRAQVHTLSVHPIAAGKIACSDCHNPHGSTGPKMLVKNTVNETCYVCHADKRGPFLWEHPPATDDCTNCHVAHGSNIAPLLKVRPPWLCQGCHAGSLHTTPAFSGRALPPSAGGTTPSAQMLLRACVNCHSAIHGSNHPSGPRFTR